MSEHQEQKALIQWARLNQQRFPELDLLFAIPNGGLRNIRVARKLKSEGVKPGVSDLFLPVARKGVHGLFIEMKTKKGKPSENQKLFMRQVKDQNYQAVICHGWDSGRELLIWYLSDEQEEVAA